MDEAQRLERTALKELNRIGLVDIIVDGVTYDDLKWRLTSKCNKIMIDVIGKHVNTQDIYERVARDTILETGFIKDEELEYCTFLLSKMIASLVSDFKSSDV